MRIAIIGIGRLGSQLAYTLLLMGEKDVVMVEPHGPNMKRAYAEYLDLLPVAKGAAANLSFFIRTERAQADAYVITSGVARTNGHQDKRALFRKNFPIVKELIKFIPHDKPLFIATNPPAPISAALNGATPLRACVDFIREKTFWEYHNPGKPERINNIVLKHKGFTAYTPAFAMALRILEAAK